MTSVEALALLLDQLDYQRGACRPNEMVVAALSPDVLSLCHRVLTDERERISTVLNEAPAAEQRIEWLHAWIATHANGSEGVISADMQLPWGRAHTPLVSSKRHLVAAMGAQAHDAIRLSRERGAGHATAATLRSFLRWRGEAP